MNARDIAHLIQDHALDIITGDAAGMGGGARERWHLEQIAALADLGFAGHGLNRVGASTPAAQEEAGEIARLRRALREITALLVGAYPPYPPDADVERARNIARAALSATP